MRDIVSEVSDVISCCAKAIHILFKCHSAKRIGTEQAHIGCQWPFHEWSQIRRRNLEFLCDFVCDVFFGFRRFVRTVHSIILCVRALWRMYDNEIGMEFMRLSLGSIKFVWNGDFQAEHIAIYSYTAPESPSTHAQYNLILFYLMADADAAGELLHDDARQRSTSSTLGDARNIFILCDLIRKMRDKNFPAKERWKTKKKCGNERETLCKFHHQLRLLIFQFRCSSRFAVSCRRAIATASVCACTRVDELMRFEVKFHAQCIPQWNYNVSLWKMIIINAQKYKVVTFYSLL